MIALHCKTRVSVPFVRREACETNFIVGYNFIVSPIALSSNPGMQPRFAVVLYKAKTKEKKNNIAIGFKKMFAKSKQWR